MIGRGSFDSTNATSSATASYRPSSLPWRIWDVSIETIGSDVTPSIRTRVWGTQEVELHHQKCPRNRSVASSEDVLEGLTLDPVAIGSRGGVWWVFRWRSDER